MFTSIDTLQRYPQDRYTVFLFDALRILKREIACRPEETAGFPGRINLMRHAWESLPTDEHQL